MNADEFRQTLEIDSQLAGSGGQHVHIVEAGRIPVADIVSREIKEFTFENGKVNRVLLTVKGRTEPVLCPLMVWGQLKDVQKAVPNMVAFTVLRSGAGKQTKYQIIPEAGMGKSG